MLLLRFKRGHSFRVGDSGYKVTEILDGGGCCLTGENGRVTIVREDMLQLQPDVQVVCSIRVGGKYATKPDEVRLGFVAPRHIKIARAAWKGGP